MYFSLWAHDLSNIVTSSTFPNTMFMINKSVPLESDQGLTFIRGSKLWFFIGEVGIKVAYVYLISYLWYKWRTNLRSIKVINKGGCTYYIKGLLSPKYKRACNNIMLQIIENYMQICKSIFSIQAGTCTCTCIIRIKPCVYK